MNIAFVVEWSRFAEEAGVNFYEIIDAIRMRPTHKNIMYPGIGVGGYCLTKDPLLASWSRQNLFNSPNNLEQSEMGVRINDKMPCFAFEYLKGQLLELNYQIKNVALLGVSYRSDVGDTRYSPVENFYLQLQNFTENIHLTDPYVKYWDELQKEIVLDFKKILSKSLDLVIITTSHSQYKSSKILLDLLMKKNKIFIYDTVGLLNDDEIKILSSKHIVRVLGRGDIN